MGFLFLFRAALSKVDGEMEAGKGEASLIPNDALR